MWCFTQLCAEAEADSQGSPARTEGCIQAELKLVSPPWFTEPGNPRRFDLPHPRPAIRDGLDNPLSPAMHHAVELPFARAIPKVGPPGEPNHG